MESFWSNKVGIRHTVETIQFFRPFESKDPYIVVFLAVAAVAATGFFEHQP